MNTPICDFVRAYAEKSALRLHMPGHKGVSILGMEGMDITEIAGADSLYEASGIIRESEDNASALYGCPTYYSTEGSSQCIRAMLFLAHMHAVKNGKRPVVAAGRNAHKTFLSAAALLDMDVIWLVPEKQDSYLSCLLTAADVEKVFEIADEKPAAVYLTNPDYLGNSVDISAIAQVCRSHGALLIVDNAHGAYLRFLDKSRHPIDLGADLCCDSAHKTLPVLTGGAYMHISPSLPEEFCANAKNALALFGSTSPSYLILQSLDAANRYIADGYRESLEDFAGKVRETKARLEKMGYVLMGDEPIKITVCTKLRGYLGTEFAEILEKQDIIVEFADPDFAVFMLTPETGSEGLARLEAALRAIPVRPVITDAPPAFKGVEKVMSVRSATFAPSETIPAGESAGRILASATVGCPPAVPIVVSGEKISPEAIMCFQYYGIETCVVVK